MSLRIYGATSGYIELDAPAVANSASVTLPTTNGVLATESFANTAGGLVYITGQNFNSVSAVNVNNCFSSTYDNYRLMLITTATGTDDVNLRLRSNGIDTIINYNRQVFAADGTTTGVARATAQTSHYFIRTSNNGTIRQTSILDIFSPFLSVVTNFQTYFGNFYSATTPYVGIVVGNQSDSSSFDGFTLLTGAGTFSGNIKVYGYKN